MATLDRRTDHAGGEARSTPGAGRQRGQETLAEVIAIRPLRSHRNGILGSLVTMARVFASPRPQAAPVRITPRPPTSPALLTFKPTRAPHDAA